MHLNEIIKLRSQPAQGIFFMLTKRCPLSCIHCCTNSSIKETDEIDEQNVLSFIDTFTVQNAPQIILLTGGEALLRPELINKILDRTLKVGTKSYLMSGFFFANANKFSSSIESVIKRVDHLAVSIDEYHEKEVSRLKVFEKIQKILTWGISVSIQTCKTGVDDPYYNNLIYDIKKTFQDRVPVFSILLKSFGRAADWYKMPINSFSDYSKISPCKASTWPAVYYNGNISACCNQVVVEGNPLSHLFLGNIENSNWSNVREKILSNSLLRAIRLYGPNYIGDKMNIDLCSTKQCTNCRSFSSSINTQHLDDIEKLMTSSKSIILEEYIKDLNLSDGSYSLKEDDGTLISLGM